MGLEDSDIPVGRRTVDSYICIELCGTNTGRKDQHENSGE